MNPDWLPEYRAATEAVAVANLCARGRLRVTGADRARFLQGQFTNDIAALQVGQGCYAALCNAKGKMRGDAMIYCLTDSFLLDVEVGQAEPMRLGLGKFVIADDVEISDASAALAHIALLGPKSREVVAKISPPPMLLAKNYRGYDVIFPAPQKISLDALKISAETLEILRIEAGIPRYGVDMDGNTIPIEAGIEARAISYTKGCYIGQEVIARIHSGGHVNRYLVGLRLAGSKILSRGEKILHEGKEVGVVTSACLSPKHGGPLALGYVRREAASVGQKFSVGASSAEIISLPHLSLS